MAVEASLVPGICPRAARVEDKIRFCDHFGAREPSRFCVVACQKLPDLERYAWCQLQFAIPTKGEQLANSAKLLLGILKRCGRLIRVSDELIGLVGEEHLEARDNLLLPGLQKGVSGFYTSDAFEMVIEDQLRALERGNATDQPPPEHQTRIVAFFERFDVVADRVEPDLLQLSNAC